jgi:hypothetical protein
MVPKTWRQLLDKDLNPVRKYTFDEGLKRAFPKERSKRKREQLYREFWCFAIRHDHAINLGKKQPDDTIPDPSEATVAAKIEEQNDRHEGLSEQMVKDMQEWRAMQITESRRSSGRKRWIATVRKRKAEKKKKV